MATELRIDAREGQNLAALFRQVEQALGNADPLLKRFGVTILKEIAENFRVGGRPAWKPLAASTQAARRSGKGGQILVNTGRLRDSFDFRTSPKEVVVFSNDPVSVFAQDGTKPHDIVAKNAKALAIPTGAFTKAGLGGARATGRGSYRLKSGKVKAPGKNFLFRKKVHHPGTPARPLLPTDDQILPKLEAVAVDYLQQNLFRFASGK